MWRIRIIKYILILLLLISCPAFGADYTVTQTGSGADYSAAEFNALSGDKGGNTYYFSGTFTTKIEVDGIYGNSSNQLVIDGYQAGDTDPINDCDEGNFTCDGNTASSAILAAGLEVGDSSSGPDYVTVQDFRITSNGKGYNGFQIYCDANRSQHLIIQRNFVYNCDERLFGIYKTDFVIIRNNKFFVYGQSSTDPANAFTIYNSNRVLVQGNEVGHDEDTYPSGTSSAELISTFTSTYLLIEYNDLYGASDQSCLRPKEGGDQNNIVVRFNKLHDSDGASGKGFYPRTGGSPDIISNTYVYGNFIYSNTLYGILIGQGVENIYVWSNIIADNGSSGINIWQEDTDGGYYFYNNTIVRNNSNDDTDDNRGGFVFAAGDNINIKNNILWNNRPDGGGGKYNQYYSVVSPSSMEHDTLYHTGGTANFYHDGAMRTLATMQGTYNYEDDSPAGEIADPSFTNPDGADETYGTNDDDYTLTSSTTLGTDLSQCFYINISNSDSWFETNSGYGTITICTDDSLNPNLDWTVNASQLATEFTSNPVLKRDTYGWVRGAYTYALSVNTVSPTNGATEVPTNASATWDYGGEVDGAELWLDSGACDGTPDDYDPILDPDPCNPDNNDCEGDESADNTDKTYDMSTLVVSTTYCLTLLAYDGAVQGEFQQFEFTTASGPPTQPTSLGIIKQSSAGGNIKYSTAGGNIIIP